MHEIPNRPLYRWTEYQLDLKRMADARRRAWAYFLGALTAAACAGLLVYVAG
jgi:hypothetical protein